ncbi:MAG TPA: ATP-binding protein [Holophagaceae bacterium]
MISTLRRLDIRILLILTLILAALVAVFGWRMSSRQGDIYSQSVAASARVLAQTHANDAAHFLVIREYAGLEEHLFEVAQMPDILGLEVYDAAGAGICAIGRPAPGSAPAQIAFRDRSRIPTGARETGRREGDRLIIWTPIEAGDRLGWLRLEYSLAAVREVQREVWRNSALMGALLVLAGTALMYLVLRPPLLAIRGLARFARDLNRRKGDRVAVPGLSLEIDEMAVALNDASSELASSERRLIEEQERLAVTIGSIGDGVMACDRAWRVTLMNRVAESLTGWTMAEAQGRPLPEVFRLLDGQTGEPLAAPFEGIMAGRERVELTGHPLLVARDGTRRPVADSGAPILSAEGEILGMVLVFRDESARIQAEQNRQGLEEQLRQAQKMEAVGQMAGGIAHDFNNILTAIIGYTSLLISQASEADPAKELAQRVLRAADRAAGLTRSLLAFSRKQKMELRPVDLNEILKNQEHLLRRLIGEDILLRVELAPGHLIARVDAGQIEQVILNLVTNARDAMPRGGLLSLTAHAATLEAPPPGAVGCPSLEGACALLCVSDSGAGMDAATLERIFDPFFTTKAVGKGTGLGLAIVHGIIQQHGGLIRVYSHPGIGTTFKIYLPRLDSEGLAPETGEELLVRGGTERILLVEDETDVRRVVRMMLEGGGYRVIEAGDGAEALALLEREAAGVPLVVSDVIMPGMTGKELHDRLALTHPGTRVLYLSGYTADIIQHKGFLESEADLLMKPFSSRALLARVRELLDRPAR